MSDKHFVELTRLHKLAIERLEPLGFNVPRYGLPNDLVCGFDIPTPIKGLNLQLGDDYQGAFEVCLRILTESIPDFRVSLAKGITSLQIERAIELTAIFLTLGSQGEITEKPKETFSPVGALMIKRIIENYLGYMPNDRDLRGAAKRLRCTGKLLLIK